MNIFDRLTNIRNEINDAKLSKDTPEELKQELEKLVTKFTHWMGQVNNNEPIETLEEDLT